MATTITVPVGGKPPTQGSRVFLDRHGVNYLMPAGTGTPSKPHSVALCVGMINSTSNGKAAISLLESHPACQFIEELAEEGHLQLTADGPNCAHLTLTKSPGSSGHLEESLTVPLMESKMQTVTRHAPRIVKEILNAEHFTAGQKVKQITTYLNALGRRRLTESLNQRSTAGANTRRVADVLRGCRRNAVVLQESAEPTRFNSVKYLLRHCSR